MVPRRTVLKAIASLPLAAVLADPRLARAAAANLQTVRITTLGGRNVAAALALAERTPASAVMLVHEWWGLNDQIKSVAAELAKEGYITLAADLYEGAVTDEPSTARRLMQNVDPVAATDTLASWIGWLKAHPKGRGQVATIGWCFGGGWSLNASLAAPVDATVVYYGDVAKSAAELAPLEGPVLGHFATRDRWVNREMMAGFEEALKEAGKRHRLYWYEADHAFANPTGARYDAAEAALAWERTLVFLRRNLA